MQLNQMNIDEVLFLPNHKYSFIFNDISYVGYFKKREIESHFITYVFTNFTIKMLSDRPQYLFDFQYHHLSPLDFYRLSEESKFSDSDTDGLFCDSPDSTGKDEFDDYVSIELEDVALYE